MNIKKKSILVTPAQEKLLYVCQHSEIDKMLESVKDSHEHSMYFLQEDIEPITESSYFTNLLVDVLHEIDKENLLLENNKLEYTPKNTDLETKNLSPGQKKWLDITNKINLESFLNGIRLVHGKGMYSPSEEVPQVECGYFTHYMIDVLTEIQTENTINKN
ncbi:MAG: hypothetical protein ACWA41_12535 [Putridiphycobacter sp.]